MYLINLLVGSIAYFKWIILASLLTMSCNSLMDRTIQTQDPNLRINTWSITGFGGGGAMFNPAVSPHNPNFAIVACDMTGNFITYNGGLSWRMFSLRGPVKYFVFDPVDSNIVYAKSIALFKSTDRGNTWNILYPGATEIKGVMGKGDHSYELIITNDSSIREVLAIAVDPENSINLHAIIAVNNVVSYYFSNDQGLSWNRVKDLETGAKNLYVAPSSPYNDRTLYFAGKNSITVRENGIWKTNPGPANVGTLNELTAGFDQVNNKYIIYAISGKSYFNPENDHSGIYYTENGGETWENRQEDILKYRTKNADFPEWRSISTSALNPEVLYVSYAGLKVHNDTICIGVAKSEDFGKTWKLAWKDCITKGSGLYSGNYRGGWIDERFAPTWGENPFSIAVSPVNPDICYTTDFGRTIKTTDGGKTWEQVYTKKKDGAGWVSRGLDVSCGYGVVFDPFDLKHLFITNTDVGLMESMDGGESWTSATLNNGVPRNWINSTYCLSFDPEIKGKAWAAMSDIHDLPRPKMWKRNIVSGFEGGILVTENSGKTWQALSKDIGEAAITHVFLDPASSRNARTLYACAFGKGVYKSIDGGLTWKQKNIGIDGKEPFAWRIVKNEKNGALFLIVIRRSDNGSIGNELDGAIYSSDDGAESWKKLLLPEGTNGPTCLMIDPVNTDRLLVSAWGRTADGKFSPDIGGGIFISNDVGATWNQVLKKDQNIHDLSFDARNNTYYACGFNGSAYRSEDHGETWSRIKGYNFKWGRRVDPDPRDVEKIFITTFGGGVWYGPAKGDENAVEDIVTPIFAY
jgi:photosystem II stability/assembly factor-like uncharacterized protein